MTNEHHNLVIQVAKLEGVLRGLKVKNHLLRAEVQRLKALLAFCENEEELERPLSCDKVFDQIILRDYTDA